MSILVHFTSLFYTYCIY